MRCVRVAHKMRGYNETESNWTKYNIVIVNICIYKFAIRQSNMEVYARIIASMQILQL